MEGYLKTSQIFADISNNIWSENAETEIGLKSGNST